VQAFRRACVAGLKACTTSRTAGLKACTTWRKAGLKACTTWRRTGLKACTTWRRAGLKACTTFRKAGAKACTTLATAAITLALLAAFASPTTAASLFDPLLHFRALPTEHFVIYFHQGEDRLAQRLAVIAEDAWRALQFRLDVTPPRRTRVVLADQTEIFNGYATPLPYDTIVIYTVAPSGAGLDFGDWLRVAFTHEFTHIVHLDRSEGWAHLVRSIFGRTVYAFPNLFLPPWQVEGLATYEETVITGEGRLHAGDFRAIVGQAAREGRLEPLDRVNGGVTDWPGGAGAYAYGVGFHQYLADRFGADRLASLATATAGRLPYLAPAAFRRVYGESLGDLWTAYEAALTAAAASATPVDTTITRLTNQGFSISGPRFDRFTCAGCAPGIVYTAVNPRGFPALYRIAAAGAAPRRLATRYLGSTAAIGRDEIYFDQVEQRRNVGLYSDLYVLNRHDGHVHQLTNGARVQDPDLSPDGTTIVAVQNRPGQRDLVLIATAGLKARTTSAPTADSKSRTTSALAAGAESRTTSAPAAGAESRTTSAPAAGSKSRTTSAPTAGSESRTTSAPAAGAESRTPVSNVVQAFRPAIVTLISEPDTQFDAPRWSPDGTSVAVERHRLGATPEIVVVDVATRAVRIVASAAHTRYVTPAWSADGQTIIAAAAAEDETFNLVEVSADGSRTRQLTHTTGGALWPDVSPDGKTIVFAGYTTGGYDLFTLPYPEKVMHAFTPATGPEHVVQAFSAARGAEDVVQALTPAPGAEQVVQALPPAADPQNVVQAFRPASGDTTETDSRAHPRSEAPEPAAATQSYSPLDTLKPTSWTPIVETGGDQIRVGAGIAGYDVLGYHAYAATATWLVSHPADALPPRAATPDWQIDYLYDRWRPTFYVSARSDTSFFAGPATENGTPSAATRRERQLETGILFPIRHARAQHAARVSLGRATADYTVGASAFSRDRTPLRASWQSITAHRYGYSISREAGIAAGASTEIVRRSFGSFADATTTTADLRVYLPGLAAHHVIALRGGGGASIGDPTVGRTFLLGGDSPGAGVADFDGTAFTLLRGFPANTFAGSRIAVANAEYRWPLARPQRGHGTWPLFLHSVHAAVFADAGHAWTRAFQRGEIKSSAGAQLSADLIAGFFAPFTATIGAAWGHDGSGRFADGVTTYFRVGKGF
jgi:hypothetical protein